MPKGIIAQNITEQMRVTEFWMQVDRRGPDDCWPWLGYVEKGYGKAFDGQRMRPSHELALTYTTGEIRQEGFETCHSCHTPLCNNPSHLRFDIHQGNVDDCVGAKRHAFGERNGHARLTTEQVVAIRVRHAGGATGRMLACDFGLSEASVQAIVTGRRWAHAPGPIRTSRPINRKKKSNA